MLAIALIVVVALVGLFLIIVALQPAEFRIVRSAAISAPIAVVFAQVNDLPKWKAWSPWAKMDPAAKNTYEGPEAGLGAIFSWQGNKEVGEGRMTIIESRPGELVRIKLEFFKPFKATHTAEFTFEPNGPQTIVTWIMTGKNNFMAKAFTMVMNCDQMIGGQFEKGLVDLNAVSAFAAQS